MQDDITRLQETVAHQARDITHLSDELYKQQREITILRQQLQLLAARQRAAASDGIMRDPQDETPPPHY